MSAEATDKSIKRKRESDDDGEITGNKLKKDMTVEEKSEQASSTVSNVASKGRPTLKRSNETGSELEANGISQEDLLAQLGLNSVKKLHLEEPDPNQVVEPEPPKQSILELMKPPGSKKVMLSSGIPKKEKPLTNGSFAEVPEDVDNIENKEKLIACLQNNLRNEEAKLMLLRKLYACQNDKSSKEASPVKSNTATIATTSQQRPNASASQRKTPLLNSAQRQHPQQKGQKPTAKMPHKPKSAPILVQKPPQPNVPAVQPRVVFLSQPRLPQPVVIAPKLLATPEGKHDGGQAKVHLVSPPNNKPTGKQHHPTNPRHASKHTAENGLPKPKMRSPQLAEQSHAEAKLALRKQLEKTLLEIPLPKPPVQDWNFVPSVNTQDFTILVGLEGVVNHIVESQMVALHGEPTGKAFTAPKFCTQCDTDFTPGWRCNSTQDDGGSSRGGTLCESCHTQKIKKSLKTEHTARLKDAFMKALKQEQEVEKKYQLSGGSAATSAGTAAAVKPQPSRVPSARPQPTRVLYHAVHPQPQVYQPHHSLVHQLQHQDLDGSHRHEPARYFTYVGHPPPKQQHNYVTENERQREYLLDMIPSGHSSRAYRI